MLASLGTKGKNRNSLACLRNAGSHSAESYCIPLGTYSSFFRPFFLPFSHSLFPQCIVVSGDGFCIFGGIYFCEIFNAVLNILSYRCTFFQRIVKKSFSLAAVRCANARHTMRSLKAEGYDTARTRVTSYQEKSEMEKRPVITVG